MKDLISVIIPVYNAEKYIEVCMESVLKQTYPLYEVIMVDDGSSDRSGEICDNFCSQYENVRVIHQENQGAAIARENGIRMAQGEFIAFVDSDDHVSELFLEKLHETIGDSELAICGFCMDKTKEQAGIINHQYSTAEAISVVSNKDFSKLYSNLMIGSLWNKLYRKECIRKWKVHFRRNCHYLEDLYFNLNYMSHIQGKYRICNDILYQYIYQNTDSVMHKHRDNIYELADHVSRYLVYCVKERMKLPFKDVLLAYDCYLANLCFALDDLYESDNKRNRKRIKNYVASEKFQRLVRYLYQHKQIKWIEYDLLQMNRYTAYYHLKKWWNLLLGVKSKLLKRT